MTIPPRTFSQLRREVHEISKQLLHVYNSASSNKCGCNSHNSCTYTIPNANVPSKSGNSRTLDNGSGTIRVVTAQQLITFRWAAKRVGVRANTEDQRVSLFQGNLELGSLLWICSHSKLTAYFFCCLTDTISVVSKADIVICWACAAGLERLMDMKVAGGSVDKVGEDHVASKKANQGKETE